ncbi:MAG: T9SS type A sorting domain-containing protein [Chitinophagales bacterium]|nr:T9SS type A sorting domain-containing protein [Chitinophagales bacterium]
MKNKKSYVFLYLLILIGPYEMVGQNYYLGQEVNDTIMKFNYGTIDACFPDPDVSLGVNSNLIPLASGLQIKLVIDEIIPDTGVIGTDGGLLSVGDELFFNDTTLSYPIYFYYAAEEIKYSYIVTGIPNILGEEYYCGVDSAFSFANCSNWFEIYPESSIPNCQIMNASETSQVSVQQVKIYPNPVKETLEIKTTKPIKKIKVYDLSGNLVLKESGRNNRVSVDFSYLQDGMYILKVTIDNFVVIEKIIKR